MAMANKCGYEHAPPENIERPRRDRCRHRVLRRFQARPPRWSDLVGSKTATPVVPAVFAISPGRRRQPRCTAGARACHTAAMATANRLTRSPLVHRLVINPFVFRLIFTSFATTRFASQTRLLGGDDWLFFNYGYEEDPPIGISLEPAEEPHPFLLQLHHRTGLEPRGHRVRQKQAPPAQPGFRGGQCPGSALRRRILRRVGQRRGL